MDHRVIVVPVANPTTALAMLKLAKYLANPEEGRVIALFVATGDTDSHAEQIDKLENVVKAAQNENGVPIEFQKQIATSAIRGILDGVREARADLLILGVARRRAGELGAIAENVAQSAPCEVLIYRAGSKTSFDRIVIPADGTPAARAACELGIVLGAQEDCPVEAIYAQMRGQSRWEGQARLAQSLDGLDGQERVSRRVIMADQPVIGVLTRVEDDDLVIVGITERGPFERWLFGNFARKVLDRAPGPVILVSQLHEEAPTGLGSALRRGLNLLRLNLSEAEQEELEWQGDRMGAASLDFFVLAIIAATLASLGLILNSATVIIGAMLVAPLMQPLIALAVGLSTWNIRLVRRGSLTLIRGIGTALLVSMAVAVLISGDVLNSEILARTNPSLPDLGVAFVSGIIGAYATVRKDIPAALAGVAIAAALMPPLCVVGLNVASGNTAIAERALLLFLTNIAAITVAAWLCFVWAGLRPQLDRPPSRVERLLHAALILALILLVGGIAYVVNSSNNRPVIERSLRDVLAPAEVVTVDLIPDNPMRLVVTLRAETPPSQAQITLAELALNEALSVPVQLEAVVMTRINGNGSPQGRQ